MSMLWFRALREYEYAMRVDEDVCIMRLPGLGAALAAKYAFGLDTVESHLETVATFGPWVREYSATVGVRPTIPPVPTNRIYFTNFFISRVDFWSSAEVQGFLDAVNRSGGIYAHRWGDAPIQTAALRLYAPADSVVHLDMDYLHLSTRNKIVAGEETTFNAAGVRNAHFRRLAAAATNATNQTTGAANATSSLAPSLSPPPAPPAAPPMPPTPPAAPPMPPLVPGPSGFTTVATISHMRAAIAAAAPLSSLSLYLPTGTVLLLGGSSIVVNRSHLKVVSHGNETVIDAAHRSRAFTVVGGGSLWLQSLVVANGRSDSDGGAVLVDHAHVTLVDSVIVNSSTSRDGGAVFISSGGRVTVTNGSSVVNSSSGSSGGAIHVGQHSSMILAGRSSIVNSTTAVSGGAVFVDLHGSLRVTDDSSIVNSRSTGGYFGGAIYVFGVARVEKGSKIVNASSQGPGGAVALPGAAGAEFVLSDRSSIVDSVSDTTGGAIYITVGTVTVTGNCAIINSRAPEGGAVYVTNINSLITLIDSFITGSQTFDDGGNTGGAAIFADGGTVTLINSSIGVTLTDALKLRDSNALRDSRTADVSTIEERAEVIGDTKSFRHGAGVFCRSGTVQLFSSTIANCYADCEGGAIYMDGGRVTLAEGTLIVDSLAQIKGGAVSIKGAQAHLVMTNSSMVGTFSRWGLVGAVSVTAGRAVIMSSVIALSSAYFFGGAVGVEGGSVEILDSHIDEARSGGGGGCFFLTGGELILRNTTVAKCNAGAGGKILMLDGASGANPVLRATFTTFEQQDCEGILFDDASSSQIGPAQVLLREVTFTPLTGCSAAAITAPAAFRGITTKACGGTYTSSTGDEVGVCNSESVTACASRSIAGPAVVSLTCACPWPEFISPASDDVALAPYLPTNHPSGGCITPRMFERLVVESDEVAVSLTKPARMSTSINVTLFIRGDDHERPANWTVSNAEAVREQSPWLHLVSSGGEVGGADRLSIPLSFSADRLPEKLQPYTETLHIRVHSDLEAVAHTEPLRVLLQVRAVTKFGVWGEVEPGMECTRSRQDALAGAVLDTEFKAHFTACDDDSLPVDHEDTRHFAVLVTDASGSPEPADIPEYRGKGVYNVKFRVTRVGTFNVSLVHHNVHHLDVLTGSAACPQHRIALSSGECGCGAGFKPDGASCQPCDVGTFKAAAGGDNCEACSTGTFQAMTGRSGCSRCAPGKYQPERGAAECTGCDVGQGSSRGSARCTVCAEGFYRPRSDASVTACTQCSNSLAFDCPWNATTETLNLTWRHWRHSPSTRETWACKRSDDWSPCRGGADAGVDGGGYCEPGYRGPRCELCDGPAYSTYFDKLDARCHDCGDVMVKASAVFGAIVLLIVAIAAGEAALSRKGCSAAGEMLRSYLLRLRKFWRKAGMRFKVREPVVFACALPMPFDPRLSDPCGRSRRSWAFGSASRPCRASTT